MTTTAAQLDEYLRSRLESLRQGEIITTYAGDSYTIQTDAGRQVDKNLEYTEHPDDMPALAYYTGRNDTIFEGAELGMENHLQEISIEGFIADDRGGNQGDALKTDLSVLIKADPYFGGLIAQLQGFTTDSSINIGQSIFSVVKVAFSVLYTTPAGSE